MISLACEAHEHDRCYRAATCDCVCGHPGQLTATDRARLERRPAPRRPAQPERRDTRTVKKPVAPRARAPRPPRPVQVVDLDEARRLYETEHLSLEQTASRLKISKQRLRDALAAAGVTIRPRGDRSVVLPDDELTRRYLDGESLEALGEAYGVASTTIRGHLHKRGVTIRSSRSVRRVELPISDAALADLYTDQRLSLRDLAERFGVSDQTINRRLRAHGVQIRPGVRPGHANLRHVAVVATNAAGQRICPECRLTVLVRKNPHGPGRYPARCEACKAKRAAA